uniref:DUF7054 domain-containing protein n=1 Tax=Ananas comosus var. bracteatus TaxID=296719 RepID=A0A6V7Q138_ANACO|nr:unnamed protein product [Ananas comosus var. bracteatus]
MRRVPAKVLVNVTVLRSPGPVQVMASMEWSVADLVAAAMQLYVKEGRQPPPPTTAPSAFSLHYSSLAWNVCPAASILTFGSKGEIDRVGLQELLPLPQLRPCSFIRCCCCRRFLLCFIFFRFIAIILVVIFIFFLFMLKGSFREGSKIGMTWLKFIDFSL